jgi:hypothetical protein
MIRHGGIEHAALDVCQALQINPLTFGLTFGSDHFNPS